MSLAKDEVIGLVVAAVVGAAALADFAYHQGKSSTPPPPPEPEPVKAENDQAARDEYASTLQDAFSQDQQSAAITVETTTLTIKWEMCSKQMLSRLLRDDTNYQVQNIRRISGISVAALKKRGFKKVACDDGRQNLKPSVETL